MQPSSLEIFGTVTFAMAVLHTFCAGFFQRLGHRYRAGSVAENLFHFLGEVEAVFGIWAGVFILGYSYLEGFEKGAVPYLEAQNFTEPAFVFVIMSMAATRPIVLLAEKCIAGISRRLPLPPKMAFYATTLILGPILGSFITEPAAMTVTALILLDSFYSQKMSDKFKYATLGLLFVNISIGGTLTHFAAPPVLMVAGKYGWGILFMLAHFGWKAVVAILINTAVTVWIFRKDLSGALQFNKGAGSRKSPAWWITAVHLLFIVAVVATVHHLVVFMGFFLFFLGFTAVTQEYQDELKLKESLMVGFFLAGLVVLGTVQKWWLQDLLLVMSDQVLYFGATFLTAFTDNAALTYLGSLVDLSHSARYSLVAGAVTGGGLTVIANAPNPAGYGLLKSQFKEGVVSPLGLVLGALGPTLVAMACFELLPNL